MITASRSLGPAARFLDRTLVRPVWLSALALCAAACSSTTKVTVDSLAKPDAADAISYSIKSSNPQLAKDSLRYKEAADYVRTALSGKGMYEAPPGVTPHVVIDLDYGLGPPQTKVEIKSEPIYKTMPGGVRTEVRQTPDGSSQTVTVREQPVREISGYDEYEVAVTVYEKYLRITARENAAAAEGRPVSEIWTVDVTSEGRSRDLRKTLPVLVGASIDYIGKDSRGQKTIRLKEDDADVVFVKKGM